MSGSKSGLTPKQEAFCVAYMETGNASEAYRSAYEAASMKSATIHREANSLIANPKVATRLAELRKPAADSAVLSLAQHLRTLAEIRDKAIKAEEYGAAVSAERVRGLAAGLHIDRKEVRTGPLSTLTDQQLDQLIAAIAAGTPAEVFAVLGNAGEAATLQGEPAQVLPPLH